MEWFKNLVEGAAVGIIEASPALGSAIIFAIVMLIVFAIMNHRTDNRIKKTNDDAIERINKANSEANERIDENRKIDLEAVQAGYADIADKNNKHLEIVQTSLQEANASNKELMASYNNLQTSYNNLQISYNELQRSYHLLLNSCSKQE